ncbi:oligosaccharide flippase family protein, partial [Candidatus Omnitrophota bacterium]
MTFIKNSLMTILARVFTFACALTVSIYVARILGPGSKGAYALLLQSVSILVLLGMLGINYPIVYLLGKKKTPLKELYPNVILIIAVGSLVLLSGFFLSLDFLRSTILKEIKLTYILAVICSFPALVVIKLSSSIILGANRIKLFNLLNVITSVVLLLNFVIFVMVLKLNLLGACLGFLLSAVLTSLFYTVAIFKMSKISLKPNWSIIKELLAFGLKAFLIPFFLLLNYRINFFMINHFMEIAMVGYFSVAFSFAEILFFIPEAIS